MNPSTASARWGYFWGYRRDFKGHIPPMPLTELQSRSAKPRDKDYKLSDAKGLHLLVKKSGAKFWRLKYRFLGREKLLSIGQYPDVKLSQARDTVDDARKNLKNDVDPGNLKRISGAARIGSGDHSFKVIGTEWFAKRSPAWSEVHQRKTWWILEKIYFRSWVAGLPTKYRPMSTWCFRIHRGSRRL